MKYYLLRILCFFIGHDWGSWAKMQFVPEGGTGFATMAEKCTRPCSRCCKIGSKEWSVGDKALLRLNQLGTLKALKKGYFGSVHGVRFIEPVKKPALPY